MKMRCNVVDRKFVRYINIFDGTQSKNTDTVDRDFMYVKIGTRSTLFLFRLRFPPKHLFCFRNLQPITMKHILVKPTNYYVSFMQSSRLSWNKNANRVPSGHAPINEFI